MKNPRRADRDARRGHTKAPPNGFILFRSDYKSIPRNQITGGGLKKKETEITKDAAAAWKELPQVVRDSYLNRARNNLAEHKREHRDYWSKRRGRDGRFAGIQESDRAKPAYSGDDGRSNGAGSLLLCPEGQPLSSTVAFPRAIGPFCDPGSVHRDPLNPPSHPVAAASPGGPQARSFLLDVPFHDAAPANSHTPPLRVQYFSNTSSTGSQPFPVHAPSSVYAVQPTPAVTFPFPYNDIPSLHTTTQFPTSASPTCPDLYQSGGTSLNQNTIPLQVPLQSIVPDFSSRTLTLSSSDWEIVDLFLGISSTSAASTSTAAPHGTRL